MLNLTGLVELAPLVMAAAMLAASLTQLAEPRRTMAAMGIFILAWLLAPRPATLIALVTAGWVIVAMLLA